MVSLTATDIALLCIAAYVAIAALVRLMRNRRDELLVKLRSDMEVEKQRQTAKEKREQKQKNAA